MKVKVIESNPESGQDSIDHLVGKTFSVIEKDKDTGAVTVISEEFGGKISLNRDEYRRLHVKTKAK